PNSLALAAGQFLSAGDPGPIFGILPSKFGGTTVAVTDANGNTSLSSLLYVSPGEIGFLVPPGTVAGSAKVTVASGAGTEVASNIQVAPVAPGLFTLNNAGLAAAYTIRVSGGSQIAGAVYSTTS